MQKKLIVQLIKNIHEKKGKHGLVIYQLEGNDQLIQFTTQVPWEVLSFRTFRLPIIVVYNYSLVYHRLYAMFFACNDYKITNYEKNI